MAKLSKETKQRLQQVFQCGQFIIRWGFIPTVLYLVVYKFAASFSCGKGCLVIAVYLYLIEIFPGFKRGADPGMPEPTVLSLLWG